MTVAVLGLGAMGARIAGRLLERGEDVLVWNRSREKLVPLIERGARAAATPADAAARAEVVVTSVADPRALRDISEGPNGLSVGAHASSTVIEMSTVGPAAVERLRATLPSAAALVDAPVLGSIAEAEAGTLTIFVGGSEAALARVRPLLAHLGTVIHTGVLGSGASSKLVANAALLGTLALLGEAIALGDDLGLPDESLYEVLAATPLAGQATRRRFAIASGEFERRFALSLAVKDAELILGAARSIRPHLLEATKTWFADAEAAGLGDRDYTAVLATIISAGGATSRTPPSR